MGAELPTKGEKSPFGNWRTAHVNCLTGTKNIKLKTRPDKIGCLVNRRLLSGRRSRSRNKRKVIKYTFRFGIVNIGDINWLLYLITKIKCQPKLIKQKYNKEQHFNGYALFQLILHTCSPIASSPTPSTWVAIFSATPTTADSSPRGDPYDELIFSCIQTGFIKLIQHE